MHANPYLLYQILPVRYWYRYNSHFGNEHTHGISPLFFYIGTEEMYHVLVWYCTIPSCFQYQHFNLWFNQIFHYRIHWLIISFGILSIPNAQPFCIIFNCHQHIDYCINLYKDLHPHSFFYEKNVNSITLLLLFGIEYFINYVKCDD